LVGALRKLGSKKRARENLLDFSILK